MPPVETVKRGRGRPVTGLAKSNTERVGELDKVLLESGGRIINRLRLSPEATTSLALLRENLGSDRAAIEAALLELAGQNKSSE